MNNIFSKILIVLVCLVIPLTSFPNTESDLPSDTCINCGCHKPSTFTEVWDKAEKILIDNNGNGVINFIFGNSMYPYIEDKSLAVIIFKPFDELNIGDVCVYTIELDGKPQSIIHRILTKLDDNTFLMKGDNNEVFDPLPMTKDNYTGILVFHEKL